MSTTVTTTTTVTVTYPLRRVRWGAIHESSRRAVLRRAGAAAERRPGDWDEIRWDYPAEGVHTISYGSRDI